MSGGSYDYAQHKLEEIARGLKSHHPTEPHVLALAELLMRISVVMHDIEWADSCDTSWTPKLDADIRALLQPGDELHVATRQAETVLVQLKTALGVA